MNLGAILLSIKKQLQKLFLVHKKQKKQNKAIKLCTYGPKHHLLLVKHSNMYRA